jgi:hypothetical protein
VARVRVLEQDLERAQRTIQKSKKAAEVQLLLQENESLQRKLVSQEEEFRLQNQTLLTELSSVSKFICKQRLLLSGVAGGGRPTWTWRARAR